MSSSSLERENADLKQLERLEKEIDVYYKSYGTSKRPGKRVPVVPAEELAKPVLAPSSDGMKLTQYDRSHPVSDYGVSMVLNDGDDYMRAYGKSVPVLDRESKMYLQEKNPYLKRYGQKKVDGIRVDERVQEKEADMISEPSKEAHIPTPPAPRELTNEEKDIKKKIDIRKLKGKEYLDMLFCDETRAGVEFVKDSEKKHEYNFGKTYDFVDSVCPLWPKFDYEKLDKEMISQFRAEKLKKESKRKSVEVELNKKPVKSEKILEEEEVVEIAEKNLKELVNEASIRSQEKTGTEDNIFDFEYSIDMNKCTDEEFRRANSLTESEWNVFQGKEKGNDKAELKELDLDERQGKADTDTKSSNRSWTKGLKKLSILAFLAMRNKSPFKARRHLRAELKLKGVVFDSNKSLKSEDSDSEDEVEALKEK